MSALRFFRPFFAGAAASAAWRRFGPHELTAPHRLWHGLPHHALMLRALRRARRDVDATRRPVLATLFHDIVHDARRNDNEEAVVDVARRWVGERDVNDVAALMLATKAHDLGTDDPITRALLLADLGVLWTPRSDLYGFYARGIRAEYAHLPDAAYRTGRTAVLGQLGAELAGRLPAPKGATLDRNLAREIGALERGVFDLTSG